MDISPSSSLNISLSCSSNPHFPAMPLPSSSSTKKTIYFAYGSNLWREQMRTRCPTSRYWGLARLKGYEWIIYERGYANVIEKEHTNDGRKIEEEADGKKKHDYSNEVWGLVYSLETEDEKRLDRNEGVPVSYQKEQIGCEFWPAEAEHNDSKEGRPDPSKRSKKIDMLLYINRNLKKVGDIKKEYVYRMNQGIADAVKEGMPKEYVEQVLREYIREEEDEIRHERVQETAERQAANFENER
ncbi:hypothetical protein CLAFUW4_08302 [Fulvia fulva]|uniref:gamma-glutamylcyclotransferase n=1 Tax=Passalora fulva TaxID=5499 RepID=A0A9Q8LDP7_PASFU|nr:uncharacterized protein CLAFUR5_08410 [Fulvia fulva]KAK4629141.1 hypothetical protein CLAFUR4_08307 [Fulvia fulva]KAK4629959.1 hypothetical protein CLAFUR0_08302 [Fulvia fulva]UJO15590.1 hypothetical protein CLAFUR5_08410 [Fulvia fulva]WPV12523.1 hypothetical protein CLAFUW4_08302 [Fulvia fulva]WPV27364.1 hypothetical protein CLAFUW7_08302 [Fulvia fulva]